MHRLPSAALAALMGLGALWMGLDPLDAAPAGSFPPVPPGTEDPQNWSRHGGAQVDWYYSPLDQINVANVKDLRPAWFFQVDTSRGQEATPLVIDGVLYVTTAWSKVYALDARTGKKLWFFDPAVPGPSGYKSCCDVVNRGPAVYEGKVIISTVDGRLIALDAKTGKLSWSAVTVDQQGMYAITGAPRVMRGKVFIGNGGGETGVRGYVSAYDVSTGHLAWRFYTVPGDPQQGPDRAASDEALQNIASPTWKGQAFSSGGGGAVWNAIATDDQLNRVYVGTGNPFPWNPRFRGAGHGDNLFSSSILALDADTGRYVWHYQEVPGDAWDYDATEDMILTESKGRDGAELHLLMQASKDGFVYVLDRASGKLLSADPFVEGIDWADGVDLATGRPRTYTRAYYEDAPFTGSPGPAGAHTWKPSAYSALTGLLYIPTLESAARFEGVEKYQFTEGVDDLGIVKGAPPAHSGAQAPALPKRQSFLVAWSTRAHKVQWRTPVEGGGGVLATGGNLVFQGGHRNNTAGVLSAYRADTGQRLWSYETPNAILTGAISYSIRGEQYIAVMSGAGGSDDLFSRSPGPVLTPSPGRLLVFKLGGHASFPPEPPPLPPVSTAVQQPSSPQSVVAGAALYSRFCSRCHGGETHSRDVVPDLQRSGALNSETAWRAVVIDGALHNAGMISWKRFLTPQDAQDIRAYVTSQALAEGKEP